MRSVWQTARSEATLSCPALRDMGLLQGQIVTDCVVIGPTLSCPAQNGTGGCCRHICDCLACHRMQGAWTAAGANIHGLQSHEADNKL